jgi:hypothetical protein
MDSFMSLLLNCGLAPLPLRRPLVWRASGAISIAREALHIELDSMMRNYFK